MIFLSSTACFAAGAWEKQGNFYYLGKDTRDHFSASGAGTNSFTDKYLRVNDIDFLVRGENDWKDYGRLNLDGNRFFGVPIKPGLKINALHLLAGGNFGNSYEHDPALRLYGDNYYYAVVTVTFVYETGVYEQRSVPVFWDWFHLNTAAWSRDGGAIRYAGANPVRKDCSMAEVTFNNPRPTEPLKNILISDSWLSDRPYSDIFALTIDSAEEMEASPRRDEHFAPRKRNAASETADTNDFWGFNAGMDGWVPGCSNNWTAEASWHAQKYGRDGVIVIPACNWAGDKYGWLEKKITLPKAKTLQLRFWRHSALINENTKQWSDGLLKVTVKPASGNQETVYEKLYSGEWNNETADLSRFQGQTVIIRFQAHGGGSVPLSASSSPACDGEDALIDHIQLAAQQ